MTPYEGKADIIKNGLVAIPGPLQNVCFVCLATRASTAWSTSSQKLTRRWSRRHQQMRPQPMREETQTKVKGIDWTINNSIVLCKFNIFALFLQRGAPLLCSMLRAEVHSWMPTLRKKDRTRLSGHLLQWYSLAWKMLHLSGMITHTFFWQLRLSFDMAKITRYAFSIGRNRSKQCPPHSACPHRKFIAYFLE